MSYKTPLELLRTTLAALGNPVGTVAPSIPICVGKGKISVAIFFHRIRMSPTAFVVYPPSFLVTLDPETGEIKDGRDILPKDIGPDAPLDEPLPHHPDERRPDPDDADAFIAKQAKLLDTFHESWEAYAKGLVRFTPERRAKIIESGELFDAVVTKRLLPWYEGLGGPFFDWLRAVRAKSAQ